MSKITIKIEYETDNGCTFLCEVVPPSLSNTEPFIKIIGVGESTSEFMKDKTLVIPEVIEGYKVKCIEKSAFRDANIDNIVIPDSVEYINDCAFKDSNIKLIHLGSGIKMLGAEAFEGCRNLESIDLPDGIKRIKESTFECCHNLKSINLPESLLIIFDNAFSECYSLPSIVIPDNVTELGDSVFDFCESLELLHIGAGLKSIGKRKSPNFAVNCPALKKITVSSLNKHFKVEKDILYNVDEKILIKAFNNSETKKDIVIPAWVTNISHCAFFDTEIKNLNIKSPELHGLDMSHVMHIKTIKCISDSYTDKMLKKLGVKTTSISKNKISDFINSLDDTKDINK